MNTKSALNLNQKVAQVTDYLDQKNSDRSKVFTSQNTKSFVRGRDKYSNTLSFYKNMHDKSLKRQEMLKNSVLSKNKKIYDEKLTSMVNLNTYKFNIFIGLQTKIISYLTFL